MVVKTKMKAMNTNFYKKGKKYYGDQIVADKVILGTYSQVPKL